MVWEKLPIVIHCTDFKDARNLEETLRTNLFNGLEPQNRIRLARDVYTDTSKFLACTNGGVKGECEFCRKVIETQRKVAQEILKSNPNLQITSEFYK